VLGHWREANASRRSRTSRDGGNKMQAPTPVWQCEVCQGDLRCRPSTCSGSRLVEEGCSQCRNVASQPKPTLLSEQGGRGEDESSFAMVGYVAGLLIIFHFPQFLISERGGHSLPMTDLCMRSQAPTLWHRRGRNSVTGSIARHWGGHWPPHLFPSGGCS